MKKIVIIIVIIAIILPGIYLFQSKNNNLEKALSQFENSERDGFYDNKNNVDASGYIVSNKTSEGYRYGYVNYRGKVLLEAEYNELYRIMDIEDKDKVYIIAAKNGRYGVSLNGNTIIEYEYQQIEYNNENEVFLLQKSAKYGIANIDGKILIPVQNENIDIRGIYIYVQNGEEKRVYDNRGNIKNIDFNVIINPTEDDKYFIKIVENDGHYFYGVTDNNEKELIPPNYSYIEYIGENNFIVSNDEYLQGIIDSNNQVKLDIKYNLVQKIQNTNIIRTLNTEKNETEIYTQKLEKICTMLNATIEYDDETIKIYNNEQTKYFDINGVEIDK